MKTTTLFILLLPMALMAQEPIDFDLLEEDWDRKENIRTYYLEGELFTGEAKQCFTDHPGTFQYEIKDGLVVTMLGYYGTGELERHFSFQDGKEHGTLVMYYSSGLKYIEEEYFMGQPNGQFMRWYNDGRIAHKKIYEMGNLVSEAYY